MFRFIFLIILAMSVVSCASRSRVAKFEKEVDEMREDVRTIRYMTDEMRTEIVSMKMAMNTMDENVQQQTSDIQEQKEYQDTLKEMVDNIKDAVVKLESEQIPAKQEQIRQAAVSYPEDQLVLKTEQDGPVTRIYTEKKPAEAPGGQQMMPADRYPVDDSRTGFGYAVKDGVILWMHPTTDSDVLEILVSWQQLTLLGRVESRGTTWWKVKTADYTGFVNARFIIVSE